MDIKINLTVDPHQITLSPEDLGHTEESWMKTSWEERNELFERCLDDMNQQPVVKVGYHPQYIIPAIYDEDTEI